MAASENAYGEDHPATMTMQPGPEYRRVELSGLGHGEDQEGFMVSVNSPKPVFESESSRWDG